MAYRAVRLALAVLVLFAADASALPGTEFGPGRPMRLEGYWDRTRDTPEVIGEVMISAPGGEPRRFGVTAVQAYKPEEEGTQLFRFTSLQPSTLLVRGGDTFIRRFFEVPPDRKIVAFGVYHAGSGLFTLGSFEVVGTPATSPVP